MGNRNIRCLRLRDLKKEIRVLFRNPTFLLQCVLPIIMLPIILAFPLYQSFISENTTEKEAFYEALSIFFDNSMGIRYNFNYNKLFIYF